MRSIEIPTTLPGTVSKRPGHTHLHCVPAQVCPGGQGQGVCAVQVSNLLFGQEIVTLAFARSQ